MNRIVLIVALLFFNTLAARAQHDAVAYLHAEGGSFVSTGTGFFISPDGDLLSCYHVVRHARSVKVFVKNRWYSDVEIAGIAPQYDLVLIKVKGLASKTQFLSLAPAAPLMLSGKNASTYGYPSRLHGVEEEFSARITTNAFVKSERFFDNRNQRIFALDGVDLLPLDMSVYDGASGSPVIYDGRVIGVLEGSFEEGGGLGWAIPLEYLKSMVDVHRDVAAVSWPPLALLTTQWAARSSRDVGTALSQALENYTDALAKAEADARRLYSEETLTIFRRWKTILDRREAEAGPSARLDEATLTQMALAFVGSQYPNGAPDFLLFIQQAKRDGDNADRATAVLARELKDYFRRLPHTPRNKDIQHDALAHLHAVQKQMNEVDRSSNRFGASLAHLNPNVCREANRAITATIGYLEVFDLEDALHTAENLQVLVQDVFEAGPNVPAP